MCGHERVSPLFLNGKDLRLSENAAIVDAIYELAESIRHLGDKIAGDVQEKRARNGSEIPGEVAEVLEMTPKDLVKNKFISGRLQKAMERGEIENVGQFLRLDTKGLMSIPRFGDTCFREAISLTSKLSQKCGHELKFAWDGKRRFERRKMMGSG